ncbi:MAG TPA: triose-phosphate isomerase, partial [Sutterella sp.]|nr:triose-phosphate isomerase [Sutterella sp.]
MGSAWALGMQGVNTTDVDVVLCPPFPYLASMGDRVKPLGIALGAQNVSDKDAGAFTGEVSAAMLRDLGVEFVIIGHSERRTLYGETDDVVAAKCAKAVSNGLKVILCVGETLEERQKGLTFEVLSREIRAIASVVGVEPFVTGAVAYEPIWAIGTGVTASPEDAQAAHAHIRSVLTQFDATLAPQARILYGGSVKPANAAGLFGQKDINGGLIGGASLKASDFSAICQAGLTS